jgi:putative ABC transport system permease protein
LGLAVVGIGIGVALAVALARVLDTFLFNVRPTDPVTLAGVATILVIVVLMASIVPARRAAATDPATALRSE